MKGEEVCLEGHIDGLASFQAEQDQTDVRPDHRDPSHPESLGDGQPVVEGRMDARPVQDQAGCASGHRLGGRLESAGEGVAEVGSDMVDGRGHQVSPGSGWRA